MSPTHQVALMSFEAPPTDAASARAKITDPRPAVVAFVTTEHFVLQGARASTIAESTGRAGMFLATVSGGLVALGLVASASSVGTAFYAFGLVLLPTLAFVGLVTFERLRVQGLPNDHWQGFRTVAGMIAVITAVLTGSTAGLVAIVASDHSLAATLSAGAVVALTALVALMRFQHAAWKLADH
jgi:hypothetical protein